MSVSVWCVCGVCGVSVSGVCVVCACGVCVGSFFIFFSFPLSFFFVIFVYGLGLFFYFLLHFLHLLCASFYCDHGGADMGGCYHIIVPEPTINNNLRIRPDMDYMLSYSSIIRARIKNQR